MPDDNWTPQYERWRHGGWYVLNVRYPTGAVGCVSRNYDDRKWRIVCDPRPYSDQIAYANRDAAAWAERELVRTEFRALTNADIESRIAEEQAKFGSRSDNWCNWLRGAHAAAIAQNQ